MHLINQVTTEHSWNPYWNRTIIQTAKTIHESVVDDAKIISGEEKLLDFSN